MKSFLLVSIIVLLSASAVNAQLTSHRITVPGHEEDPIGFYDFKPADYSSDPSKKHPLIIVLHGQGERGNGTTELDRVFYIGIGKMVKEGATMQFNFPNGVKGSFVVLFPQLGNAFSDWEDFYIDAMVSWANGNLNIDPDRIFITGYSLGGGGVWVYPASSAANAAKIAGIIPMSGSGLYAGDTCNIAAGGTAVWAIHTHDDAAVDSSITRTILSKIEDCGPLAPVRGWFPEGSHFIYLELFPDTANTVIYPNIYQWMLGVNRKNLTRPNVAPVALAGAADTTVVVTDHSRYVQLPLSGELSYDPNDVIIHYNWSLVSTALASQIFYPSQFQPVNFSNNQWPPPNIYSKNLTWPVQNFEYHALGNYQFKLTVTDMFGLSSEVVKTIRITDQGNNTAPYVNIGSDVILPDDPTKTSVPINASVFDWQTASGALSYTLTQLSGPKTISTINWFQTTLTGIDEPGDYSFKLLARDADGLEGTDTINITKLDGPLPVTYLYFTGKNFDGKNILTWATSNEVNNSHFEVLKSGDGLSFNVAGTIPALNNASDVREYSFSDPEPYTGKSYYRLAQYDINGACKLSEVISIDADNSVAIQLYPNPVKDVLNVSVSGNIKGLIKLRVLDVTGKVLKQHEFLRSGNTLITPVSLNNLQSGLYILEITTANNSRYTKRFLK